MENRITPDLITELKENEVFVFGSNESGIHGAGAARMALDYFGAIWKQPEGLQGRSYAIPTKDKTVRNSLTVDEIKPYVDNFIEFAKSNPDKIFLVTEVGCGRAKMTPNDIAPLFEGCVELQNVHLPKRFWEILKK